MAEPAAGGTNPHLVELLNALQQWVRYRHDIAMVLLVGSQARETARADSDVDLVLLVDDPAAYLADTAWTEQFGAVVGSSIEQYGRLTALRVFYAGGPEVEFGFARPDWADEPLDPGTAQVLAGGTAVVWSRGQSRPPGW